jgi:phospholipid/cholesterol/gamma-HCH transport system substrate-binding protein
MVVGAFAIIGTIIFVYMIFLFRDMPIAMTKITSYTIKAKFEYAPGIQTDTPVKYCGYNIGRVIYVSPPVLESNGKGQFVNRITVTIAIQKKYNDIPSNVEVELARKSLSSGYIEFKSKPMTADEIEALNPKYLQQDMVLNGTNGGSEFLPQDIQDKFNVLFEKVSLLLDNVNTIVGDKENQQNLKNSLANISKATEESITTLEQIREFSAAGKTTMLTVNEELGETLIEMQRLLYKINSGEGTVGKLVNDDRLYENLLNSSEELKATMENLKKTFDKTSKDGIKIRVF